MNNFFRDAVSSLDIPTNIDLLNPINRNIQDPIDAIIWKFSSHPSILKIREKVTPNTFYFQKILWKI